MNLPISLDDQLAALAKKATSTERPSTSSISLRAGQISYNGTPVPQNKLACIILASTHSNTYYPGAYDADNPANPVCWSYSDDGKDMVPSPDATEPQADSCAVCPQNEWGSGSGKGKACKQQRVLALIPADTSEEEVPTAELCTMRIPVTSVKNYANYVGKLATLFNRPPLGMVTQISTEPNAKTQFSVLFNQLEQVANEMLPSIIARADTVKPVLERSYEANVEQAPKPTKKKKF